MDQAKARRCMCSPCSVRGLMTPGEKPARAEEWLLAEQDQNHLDAALQDRYWSIFGFAILNRATVEFLRQYSPLVEAGSGTGYWARELQDAGIDVIATDPAPETRWPGVETWTEVERLTATEALAKHPDRNMLICWPDRTGEWPEEALREFRGASVLYVGEREGGCTGTPGMFEEMERSYAACGSHEIPRFAGQTDRLYVMRRK